MLIGSFICENETNGIIKANSPKNFNAAKLELNSKNINLLNSNSTNSFIENSLFIVFYQSNFEFIEIK